MSRLINKNNSLESLNFNARVLGKDIKVVTNSLLLKKLIEHGFNCFPEGKTKRKEINMISLMLEDVQDIRKVTGSILKFINFILEDMRERCWIFHGSAFSRDGMATIMLGDSGTGKSSLCLAAGLSGASIISDEPILINKKDYSAVPFRYLIKLDRFHDIFSKWDFFKRFDFNRNRFIRKGSIETLDFNLFTKEELDKLKIKVEHKETILSKIVFLEDKKYDTAIHLYKHCINRGQSIDFQNCIRDLNKLSQEKKVIFLPGVARKLKNEKEIKTILNRLKGEDNG